MKEGISLLVSRLENRYILLGPCKEPVVICSALSKDRKRKGSMANWERTGGL